MIVRELLISWGFNVDTKRLGALERRVDGVKKGAELAGKGISGLAKAAGIVGGAVVAGGAALFGLANRAKEAAIQTAKLSQIVGVSTQSIQGLQHVAALADVEQEELTTGLRFLSRNLGEAAQGSKQQTEAFKRMGVSVRDAKGQVRGTEAVLLDLADQFKRAPDGPQKTAAAMQVFGRSGAALIPLLNKGGAGIRELMEEAKRLGIVMSDQDVKAAGEFDDALDRSTAAISGIANTIGAQLMPVITGILESFRAWIGTNREWLQQRIGEAVQVLTGALRELWRIGSAVVGCIGEWVAQHGGFKAVLEEAVFWSKLLVSVWAGFKVAQIVGGIGQIAGSVGGLVGQLTRAGTMTQGLGQAMGGAGTAAGGMAPALGGVAGQLGLVAGALVGLYTTLRLVAAAIDEMGLSP